MDSPEFDSLTSAQKKQLGLWAEQFDAYTSDSRQAHSHSIFVALKGEAHDGHDFVQEVLSKGTRAVVIEQGRVATAAGTASATVLEVASTHLAHRYLAACYRRKFKGRVVAVGGSSGKTSTKEFLATILAAKYKVLKTEKSQNGDLGIPRTLERLANHFDVAVIEVGIDAPGDMIRHAHIVAPDVAILTSIGEEHLNLLKTVERVFAEEKILFDVTLARGGDCFAPLADAHLAKLKNTSNVHLVHKSDLDPWIPFDHPYAQQNARLAIAVAMHLGLTSDQVKGALKELELPEGRGRVLQIGACEVIADHYNANPSSLSGALHFAKERASQLQKPLTLVLGDMLDLGEATATAHASIRQHIEDARPQTLWLIGPEMGRLVKKIKGPKVIKHFNDSAEAAKKVAELKSEASLLLLKGSRGMRLELVLEALQSPTRPL
jgi:UDP-N-acetylmuramoyl-tripeptide--D-alanyl-D-alanine ligase